MNVATKRATIAVVALLFTAPAAAADEWLSLGNQQWAPTVTSKSGIGTANAVAEAKVTRKELEGWCANWSPGDKGCVARELANPDTKLTYRASADCTQGRITPVNDLHARGSVGQERHRRRAHAVARRGGQDRRPRQRERRPRDLPAMGAAVPRPAQGADGRQGGRARGRPARHRTCRRRGAIQRGAGDRGEVRRRMGARPRGAGAADRGRERTRDRVRRAPRQRHARRASRAHAARRESLTRPSPRNG